MANKTHISDEDIKKIIYFYTEKQYGLQKTGDYAGGFTQSITKRVLKEQGIPIRTLAEATAVANINRRKYSCDDDYFKTETPNMAYLLGFIAADGTVSKNSNTIKISLSSVDKEFLSQIKEELKVEKPIFEYETNNGYSVAELNFTSSEMKKDLAKYNIIPRKTYSFSFPKNLNKKYWIDFIRGFFDGDGSVSTAGPSAIRWQICSHQKEVLETIIDYLYEEFNIPKVSILSSKRKDILYYFQYSSVSTRKIFSILYSPNCFCLQRKYKKFLTLI